MFLPIIILSLKLSVFVTFNFSITEILFSFILYQIILYCLSK